jgi:hypothetical protein
VERIENRIAKLKNIYEEEKTNRGQTANHRMEQLKVPLRWDKKAGEFFS